MSWLAIEKEPGSDEKTVLTDLQGTWVNLRDEVVEAAGFPNRERVLCHGNEAIAYSGPGWTHTRYQALFRISVQAGIQEAADLAGFRNRSVFIAGSRHVPPLEQASVGGNIRPFSEFVLREPGVDRGREEQYQLSRKIH
jgi:hypothetical protein